MSSGSGRGWTWATARLGIAKIPEKANVKITFLNSILFEHRIIADADACKLAVKRCMVANHRIVQVGVFNVCVRLHQTVSNDAVNHVRAKSERYVRADFRVDQNHI